MFRECPETASEAERDQSRETTVQILRKGRLLYEDPIPVELDGGTVYREYVVNEEEGSESDYNEFVWGKADFDTTQSGRGSAKKTSPKK